MSLNTPSNWLYILENETTRPPSKLLFEYLYKHGGAIDQLVIDEKGGAVGILYKDVVLPFRTNTYYSHSELNSISGRKLTRNKDASYEALTVHNLPAPIQQQYMNNEQLQDYLATHGKIVIKPARGEKGLGVHIVSDFDSACRAILHAQSLGHNTILLQQYVQGDDYRLLFVDFKLVAALRRIPPFVIGDDILTISELIQKENQRRLDAALSLGTASWRRHRLSQISLEDVEKERGLDFMRSVPLKGHRSTLLPIGNISAGALCEDVTSMVNDKIVKRLTDFLQANQLGLCGVDIISTSIKAADEWSVIELNAAPGFLPHARPDIGEPQPVDVAIVEALHRHWVDIAKKS